MIWWREILSAGAMVLTFAAFLPYIRSIHDGRTRPHVFSWLLWGSTTFVVFLAQLVDGGGAGAWPIGLAGIVTLYVAALAYSRRHSVTITRSDWFFLMSGLSALPAWALTADPLWAVVILTTIDVIGFLPTFRKSIHDPFAENMGFYAFTTARNVLAMAALEHFSATTLLFPAVTGLLCLIFIAVTFFQRGRHRRNGLLP